ncbi:MAG: VanW family protein [Bacillota bacterium]
MSKKWFVVTGIVLILITAVASYGGGRRGNYLLSHFGAGRGAAQKHFSNNHPASKTDTPKTAPVGAKTPPNGPVGEPLPWTGDTRVEELKRMYKTPVLIAAYRASLPEPILAERFNIGLAADMLAGMIVMPGEVFSQNNRIGPYTKERGFKEGPMYSGSRIISSVGGGVCKIASLLYNVATLANLRIIERHPHSMTVPYVPPGQDATVAYGVYDFRFQNVNNGPILIWSKMVENTLYIAFYGQKQPPRVTWEHKTISRSPFWTETRHNPLLPPGTEKVVIPGQEGVVVHSWLVTELPDGTKNRQDLGTDFYHACPRVIEIGPKKQAEKPGQG